MRIVPVSLVACMALALAACHRGPPPAPAGDRLYVTNEFSGDLSVIDAASGRVLQTTPLGKRPRGMAFSPDGRRLYIALTGSPVSPPGAEEAKLPPRDAAADGVGVFETGQGRLLQVLRGVPDPEQLATAPDGVIYAGSEQAGAVVIVDPGGAPPAVLPVGEEPEGVAIRPDGGVLYVTLEEQGQVLAVDRGSRKVVARVPVGERPRSVAFSPDGSFAFVTGELGRTLTIIDARMHVVLATTPIPGAESKPMGVAVSPDSRFAYVTTGRGGELVKVDIRTGKVAGSTKVGGRPWGVAVSPDGKRVYTANGPAGDVAVVDAASMRVGRRIRAGDRPWGVMAAKPPSP